MAFYRQLKGPALQAYNEMLKEMLVRATKELNLTRQELILRSLKAEDFGLSAPVWSFAVTSTNAFNTIVSDVTITDNRFVGVNGMHYDPTTELISEVRLTRKGALKRQWNIQSIPSNEDKLEYVDDPIIVDQNTTLNIAVYNRTTSTDATHELTFKGAVVEKRGLLFA